MLLLALFWCCVRRFVLGLFLAFLLALLLAIGGCVRHCFVLLVGQSLAFLWCCLCASFGAVCGLILVLFLAFFWCCLWACFGAVLFGVFLALCWRYPGLLLVLSVGFFW